MLYLITVQNSSFDCYLAMKAKLKENPNNILTELRIQAILAKRKAKLFFEIIICKMYRNNIENIIIDLVVENRQRSIFWDAL